MADNTKDQKFRYEYTMVDHDKNPDTPKIPEVTTIGSKENPDYTRSMRIDTLRHRFDQGARPNRYTVDFYCPPLGLTLEGVRCITASLPGRQLETGDVSEYGPIRKIPFNVGMDGQEVSFTFVCDSSFADRFIIEAWQEAIFGGESINESVGPARDNKEKQQRRELLESVAQDVAEFDKDTAAKIGKRETRGSSINPQFAYYNEYIGEIVIKQITRSDKRSLQYRIHEAYPVSFAPMELSAESTDQLMRFECTFAFRTWESEYSNPNPVSGINKGRRWLDAWASVTNLRNGGNGANNTLQRFNDRLAKLGGLFG